VLAKPATPYVENLMDTKDTVRRLGLIRVRDALADVSASHAAETAPLAASIDANATLREALSKLLEGTPSLRVLDAGRDAGTLDFEGLRRALTAAEA